MVLFQEFKKRQQPHFIDLGSSLGQSINSSGKKKPSLSPTHVQRTVLCPLHNYMNLSSNFHHKVPFSCITFGTWTPERQKGINYHHHSSSHSAWPACVSDGAPICRVSVKWVEDFISPELQSLVTGDMYVYKSYCVICVLEIWWIRLNRREMWLQDIKTASHLELLLNPYLLLQGRTRTYSVLK